MVTKGFHISFHEGITDREHIKKSKIHHSHYATVGGSIRMSENSISLNNRWSFTRLTYSKENKYD